MRIDETHHHIYRKQRSDKVGRTRENKVRTRPFIGWDGEGYNKDGKHYYGLFGNSLGSVVRGANLDWRKCIALIMDSPKEANHVIYAGTYDVVMMFRGMPQVRQILAGNMVHIEQYRIHFLRGKMLRITDRERKETRTLYDVFSFFATSFVKACREYLGDSPLLDEIETMKMQRNSFTADMHANKSIEDYMNQELAMLVELCEELREMLAKVNIHPSQWHGPGAVASTVLRTHKVKERKGTYDQTFRRVAESAYYGGRFEQFKRGRANQTVYQYDIRSAYPNAMQHLRALDDMRWEYGKGCISPTIDTLCHVVYHPKQRNYREAGWFPYRNPKGSIYFPDWVDGWYWGCEVPTHMYEYITEYYQPHYYSVEYPFRFVPEMYEQRAKLKAAKQPHQLALKLALNSLYGKVAQSKGAKIRDGEWVYPTYHEVVWAGQITSYTRAMIAEALHSVPFESIIATETDSIFSLEPLPLLEVGTGLGQWECTVLEDLVYLQSGVSLVKQDGEWKLKSRGFTVRKNENLLQVWSGLLKEYDMSVMEVKQTRFVTDPRQKQFGQWVDTTHNLTIGGNPLEKRVHVPCELCDTRNPMSDTLHPLIVPPIPIQPTTPYAFIWNDDYREPFAQLSGIEDVTLHLEVI